MRSDELCLTDMKTLQGTNIPNILLLITSEKFKLKNSGSCLTMRMRPRKKTSLHKVSV